MIFFRKLALLPLLAVMVWSGFSSVAMAAATITESSFDSPPHQVVQDTTEKVVKAVESGLDPAKDPEGFVKTLSKILDPVIAFEYIARGVMGSHAKSVSKEKVKEFSESFKLGLVKTYGQGVTGFGNVTITVLPPEGKPEKPNRSSVIQEIKAAGGVTQVVYIMQKNRRGEWKMTNIFLNGINLGSTFRSQFAAEVKKNKGDVIKTIDTWGKG